jgi:hypothetical protein
MEDYIQPALPIDPVIFMYYLAYHRPVIQAKMMVEEDVLSFATGEQFETTYSWRKLYDKLDIRPYMQYCPRTPQFRLQKVSPTTMKYMLLFKGAPFA